MSAKKTAAKFGCTEEQAKAQMRRNLKQVTAMRDKAERTGKRVNGYTATELSDQIAKIVSGWEI